MTEPATMGAVYTAIHGESNLRTRPINFCQVLREPGRFRSAFRRTRFFHFAISFRIKTGYNNICEEKIVDTEYEMASLITGRFNRRVRMGEITIRKAEMADAEPIANILRGIGWFGAFDSESEEESYERIKAHIALCNADDSHTVYIAETMEKQVAGYASIHWLPTFFLKAPEGYLSELFVADGYRGSGMGKTLLNAVSAEARKRGCARLMLINSRIRESYKREFYKRHGWTERQEVANFIYEF